MSEAPMSAVKPCFPLREREAHAIVAKRGENMRVRNREK